MKKFIEEIKAYPGVKFVLGHSWNKLAGCTIAYFSNEDAFEIYDEEGAILFYRTAKEMEYAVQTMDDEMMK